MTFGAGNGHNPAKNRDPKDEMRKQAVPTATCEFMVLCRSLATRIMFMRHNRDVAICDRCAEIARAHERDDFEISSHEYYLS